MKSALSSLRLLLVDSGVGGLSVLKELHNALPAAEIIYMADTAAFPHSDQDGDALVHRLKAMVATLVESSRPDMVVVTGSTASSLALESLQSHLSIPFIGCRPALERGVEMTSKACVGLLETEVTLGLRARREWVDRVAPNCKVVRVGTSHLASMAERRFLGLPIDQAVLAQEAGGLFLGEEGPTPDAVVLGSSHHWFLLEELRRLCPAGTLWIEPGMEMAQRAHEQAVEVRPPMRRRPLDGGSLALFSQLSPQDRRGVERGCAAFGLKRVLRLNPLSTEGRARLAGLFA